MKFKLNPAPNYHCGASTRKIMLELTIALLVVFAFGLFHQFTAHGMKNVIHVCALMLSSVATAVIVEMLWAVCVVKVNPVAYIRDSFPWVTSIILVLMVPANTNIYPIIIGTLFAIVVAKLFFGGFGQNVFNPAAIGCAIIFSFFATSLAADVQTFATPTKTIAATYGWVMNDPSLIGEFLDKFGGLWGLFIGSYDGAIGETCTALILLCGVYLAVRKVIDWRVPVFYLGTVFVLASIIGLVHGAGIWYPVFHVLTGGVVFGAVFMATDPVTNPTTNAGKVIFAIGCGLLTVLIRVKGSLPEGVLYSILLMNMLTPWIERACAGVQYQLGKKLLPLLTGLVAVSVGLVFAVANMIAPVVPEIPKVPEFLNADKHFTMADSFEEYPAKVVNKAKDGDYVVYKVEANGYAFGHYDDPEPNIFLITIDPASRTVVKVAYEKFNDTEYVGDNTMDSRFLSQFEGMSIDDDNAGVDTVTNATITSQSVISAVQAAVQAAR
ncbi:MAG: RnfABCDGE type electron transport complex subunit D [Erysipelotrichaceae bacterium]|nr:RnfABCDGE type electron transport complex subunit D [Erysipelotrichaceae bacterium]